MAEAILIDRISTEGTQTRAVLNDVVINEYAEAYEQDIALPPIDVYFDETVYWLADGFHRVKAAQKIGRDSISANVHPGGQRDAIFHAVGANETHGLRRTNADRRKSVLLMLNDPEWSQWSNHAIARQCLVSEISVRRVRRDLEPKGGERVKDETRKAERRGKVYTIQTGGIGAAKRKQPREPASGAGKEPELSAVATAATQEPVVLQESADVLSTTLSQIDVSTSTTPAASTETEPNIVEAVEKPLPISDELEPGPSTVLPLAVSVISAAAAAELSLEDAWEWATQADRENFVDQHRDELQKIFRKLEKAAT